MQRMRLGLASLPELTPARGIGLVSQSPLERVTSVQGEVRRPVLREPGQHRQAAAPHQDGGDPLVQMRPERDRPKVRVTLAPRPLGDRGVGERRRVLQHRAGDVGRGIAREPSQGEGRPCGSCASCVASSARRIALPRFRSFHSSRSSRRASGAPAARNSRVSVTALKASSTSRAILGIDVLLASSTPKMPSFADRFRRTIRGRSGGPRGDRPASPAGRGPEGKISRCRSAPASPEPLSIPDG